MGTRKRKPSSSSSTNTSIPNATESPAPSKQTSVQEKEKGKDKDLAFPFSYSPTRSGLSGWFKSCFDEIDNTSLVLFRLMWGFIMAYEATTYIRNDYRKLEMYYMSSDFYPKYYMFEWVSALPGDGMYYFIWSMFVLGINIAIGFGFHLCSLLFFLGWCYIILLDASLYLNHFYLIAVMAFFLIFFPANKRWSVDAYLFPSIKSNTMPRYIIYFLRIYQVIVYCYAGVAKANEDWLRGEPIRHWIVPKFERLGPRNSSFFIKVLTSEFIVYFISYGGLFFDLFSGIFLCFTSGIFWRLNFLACVFFHFSNKILFSIGIFPYVMLASTTLFFEVNWFTKFVNTLSPFSFLRITPSRTKYYVGPLKTGQKIILIILGLVLLHQIVTPVRHYYYEGDVAWNELGHRYSWRMKLRDKQCLLELVAADAETRKMWKVDFDSYLFGKQSRKIKPNPPHMIQFAHYLKGKLFETHNINTTIHAQLYCDLNYRGASLVFDPDLDLASLDPNDYHTLAKHILPPRELTEEQKSDWMWRWDWNRWMEFYNDPFHRAHVKY